MHNTSRIRVEGIPAVHGAAIVPEQQVTGLPLMRVGVLGLGHRVPQGIERMFALFHRQIEGASLAWQ